MKSFRQFLEEQQFLYHGSISRDTNPLMHGSHVGSKKQAEQRITDRTEFRPDASKFMYQIKEKRKRSPEEHIEIEDNGAPSLSHALSKAAKIGKIPENLAKIAMKKSDLSKAQLLMQHGIHRVTYKNRYEGKGVSHIIVNPDDFEVVKP